MCNKLNQGAVKNKATMKRSGFQIAGGVLEIVAGAFWLIVSLIFNNFAKYLGLKLDILQIIMPICFIIFGALSCTGKRRKSDVFTYGILNLVFIGLQFYFGTYLGLGIVQMVLLFIASLMFFISPKMQNEIEFDKKYKEYVANEPANSKRTRKIFIIVCCVVGLIFNIVLALFVVR